MGAHSWSLGITGIGLAAGLAPTMLSIPSSSHQAPAFQQPTRFQPSCNLVALGKAYAAILTQKRRTAAATAPTVYFDPARLPGTVLHNQLLVETHTLVHDPAIIGGELCGSMFKSPELRNNPQKLALYIWTRFNQSPPHAATQRDTTLRFVSVSASPTYFVVRLGYAPAIPDEANNARYLQWQAQAVQP